MRVEYGAVIKSILRLLQLDNGRGKELLLMIWVNVLQMIVFLLILLYRVKYLDVSNSYNGESFVDFVW